MKRTGSRCVVIVINAKQATVNSEYVSNKYTCHNDKQIQSY
jgi:imidazole glycerol phosphate synthase subunit HisF